MSRVVGGVAAPVPAPRNRGESNGNPRGIGLLALLREDLRTHGGRVIEQGFWAVAVHRFGNWRMGVRPRLLRAPLTVLYRALFVAVEFATGITLPYTVRLGRRVRFWHHSGIIINATAIGDDSQVRQNTTMGILTIERPDDIPTIGARVDIGAGACILGAATVGDDCKIGANCVVMADVPAHSIAMGIPARVVRRPAAVDS